MRKRNHTQSREEKVPKLGTIRWSSAQDDGAMVSMTDNVIRRIKSIAESLDVDHPYQ
jgi:hypothetical protein